MNWAEPFLHWLAVHTGTIDEPGAYYGFWSGIGSDIGELAIIGGLIGLFRKHNCHTKGCWRIGKHQVDGTPWCNHHHEAARAAVPQADVASVVAKQLEPVHQAIFRRLDDHADLIRSVVTPAAAPEPSPAPPAPPSATRRRPAPGKPPVQIGRG